MSESPDPGSAPTREPYTAQILAALSDRQEIIATNGDYRTYHLGASLLGETYVNLVDFEGSIASYRISQKIASWNAQRSIIM